MRRNYYSFIIAFSLILLITSTSFAGIKEPKASPVSAITLKGLVVDQSTNEKLAGVTIQIGNNPEKIYSEPDGSFVIPNLDPENNTITIKCISYKEKKVTVDPKNLKKGKLNVKLEPVLP